MTEQQWLESTDPRAMLSLLRETGKPSERKARLFGCAAVRRVWHLLMDERSRKAVEIAEQYADGLIGAVDLDAAAEAAVEASRGPSEDSPLGHSGAYFHATMAAWWVVNDALTGDAEEVCNRAYGATVCDPDDPEVEDEAQAVLIRDLFGNPFRPLPPVLIANGGLITQLARAAYEERDMPSGVLDKALLAILADALQEAGFEDAEMLGHLRKPDAVHVRGCAVVDYLLGLS